MSEPLETPPAQLPLVSLGMPVRNGAAHLAEALASVLGQDYANLEILISDNASTDGTPDICRTFAERDPRVRYSRLPEPVDVIPNFRRVLAQAHGAYFTWVAHDDLLLSPDYLTKIVSFLQRNPDVVLAGSSVSVLDHEGPGTVSPTFLDDVLPDRDKGHLCSSMTMRGRATSPRSAPWTNSQRAMTCQSSPCRPDRGFS
jgi:glycosyltransferase involved in cell wall biosynthesis